MTKALTLKEFFSNAGKARWKGTTKKQRSEYMSNLGKISHQKRAAKKLLDKQARGV